MPKKSAILDQLILAKEQEIEYSYSKIKKLEQDKIYWLNDITKIELELEALRKLREETK
jgi:hypothetical protein